MGNTSKLVKIVIAIILIGCAVLLVLHRRDYTDATRTFDKNLTGLLNNHGINGQDLLFEKREIDRSKRHVFLKMALRYRVEPFFDPDAFVVEAETYIKPLKWKIAKTALEKKSGIEETGKEGLGYEVFTISFAFKKRMLYEISFLKSERLDCGQYTPAPQSAKAHDAKIAIVLDDFGYNMNNLGTLFKLDVPFTISVLPNLAYSTEIAKECGRRNIEVLLHLPMEPHSDTGNLEEGTIMVDMESGEVKRLLSQAIASVPGLRGVSNHMGSKATEDRSLMTEIFTELNKKGLYFLDNLVTDRSVCKEVASTLGTPTIHRSVFLDNKPNETYITQQLQKTVSFANNTGWAIAVGHDRQLTIDVLRKTIPKLQRQGCRFVYVSELLKRDDYIRD